MTDDDLPRVEWVPGQLALPLPLPGRPRLLSLFSGYGGLDLAVAGLLGADVVGHSEVDPAACRLLEHRFPDVPNLGDVAAVDWATLGDVDVITGGFPCQDVSLAGRRLGIAHDTRSGLWAHMAAAVDSLRPSLVVIENVRGLLSARANHPAHSDVEPCPWCMGRPDEVSLRALGAVVGDLSGLGYDAAWTLVRAADVGAPHARARVFVVARPAENTDGATSGERGQSAPGEAGGGRARADARGRGRAHAADTAGAGSPDGLPGWAVGAGQAGPAAAERRCAAAGGGVAADAEGDGRHERRTEPAGQLGRPHAAVSGAVAADPAGCGRERGPEADRGERADRSGPRAATAGPGADPAGDRWGPYGPAVGRWAAVLGRPAPDPTEPGAKGGQRLSPRFVEWMMGLPDGWVTGVPGISRNDALKLLGNGVVPQQAAAAVASLLDAVDAAERVA